MEGCSLAHRRSSSWILKDGRLSKREVSVNFLYHLMFLRSVLELPANYLGNALTLVSSECEFDELLSSDLTLNAYRMRCIYANISKKSILTRCTVTTFDSGSRAWNFGASKGGERKRSILWLRKGYEWSMILTQRAPCLLGNAVEGATLIYNDWSRFPAYEIDFGSGQPSWVEENMVMVKGLVYLRNNCGYLLFFDLW